MKTKSIVLAVTGAAACGVALVLVPTTGAGVNVKTVPGQSAQAGNHDSDPPPPRSLHVECGQDLPGSLQRAIDRSHPGDTINVTGVCEENLAIPEGTDRLTLDGGGTATIHGPSATLNDIVVRGRAITIKGFTITGGRTAIDVGRSGSAVIDGNTIEGTGRFGITVGAFGTANIVNNTIRNNPSHGINLTGNGFAFIGFRAADDTVASPNVIARNGTNGINLALSASARIAGNTISDNVRNGIAVTQASHAVISGNTLDHNGQHGVFVTENSGVNLGTDTGTGLFEAPNRTTVNNLLNGVNCRVGGYANGRIGTVNGASGPKSFGASCIDGLDSPDTA
jgi:hypothetical protein